MKYKYTLFLPIIAVSAMKLACSYQALENLEMAETWLIFTYLLTKNNLSASRA